MARLNFLPPLPSTLEEFTKEVLRRAEMRAKFWENPPLQFNIGGVKDSWNTFSNLTLDERKEKCLNECVDYVLCETALWE